MQLQSWAQFGLNIETHVHQVGIDSNCASEWHSEYSSACVLTACRQFVIVLTEISLC